MAEVHIWSYFTFETDLAEEMRAWPEFRSGSGYAVELASADGTVSVSLIERAEDDLPFVRVASDSQNTLFDRVLGRVAHALAAHSDNIQISRRS